LEARVVNLLLRHLASQGQEEDARDPDICPSEDAEPENSPECHLSFLLPGFHYPKECSANKKWKGGYQKLR
jgi:hypothetical protein